MCTTPLHKSYTALVVNTLSPVYTLNTKQQKRPIASYLTIVLGSCGDSSGIGVYLHTTPSEKSYTALVLNTGSSHSDHPLNTTQHKMANYRLFWVPMVTVQREQSTNSSLSSK